MSLRGLTYFFPLFSSFLSSSHIQFSVFLLSSINENASGRTHGHIIPTPHPSQAVTTVVGKWSNAHSGNGCGSLSWVDPSVILHSSSTKTLSRVSESLFVLKGEAKEHLMGSIGTRSMGEEAALNSLQLYLMRTYQSQRQLEQGWEPTGLVWRCRGQSPADHQRTHW